MKGSGLPVRSLDEIESVLHTYGRTVITADEIDWLIIRVRELESILKMHAEAARVMVDPTLDEDEVP